MPATGGMGAGNGGEMNMKDFAGIIATGEKMNTSVIAGITESSKATATITTAIIIITGQTHTVLPEKLECTGIEKTELKARIEYFSKKSPPKSGGLFIF